MNTRLQVEHGVTEMITGVDLVRAQILSAAGLPLSQCCDTQVKISGHAIQARVYAEDPKNFYPSPGTLTVFRPPQIPGVRIDTGYAEGRVVTPHYDPLLAKVIVHAVDRDSAITQLLEALRGFEIVGVKHNIPALLNILDSAPFRSGQVHTGIIGEITGRPA